MELKDRFKLARKKSGLSQAKLGEMVGVSQSAIQYIENGRNQSSTKIFELAEALKVSPQWLLTGEGEMRPHEKESVAKLTPIIEIDPWDDCTPLGDHEVEVPFYKDVMLSAGDGCFSAEDYSGRKLRFSKRTLGSRNINPKYAACVTAKGDSMEPAIPDGCTVAINMEDKEIKDGQIYAINNDGLLQIKVLRMKSGSEIIIESYNKEYPPITASIENISVIGRVFWYSVLL